MSNKISVDQSHGQKSIIMVTVMYADEHGFWKTVTFNIEGIIKNMNKKGRKNRYVLHL